MSVDVARKWMTEELAHFFDQELINERHGGAEPATVSSAIDSLTQAPDDVLDMWVGPGDTGRRSIIHLAAMAWLAGVDTELRDLLR